MDPLVEYKKEAYRMFKQFLTGIKSEITNMFFKVNITQNVQERNEDTELTKAAKKAQSIGAESTGAGIMRDEAQKQESKNMTVIKGVKIGRNDPCPCGSGKKYKKCHGK